MRIERKVSRRKNEDVDEEETLLLEELSKNIDIQLIAQFHNRTIGGINARRREIAYKLYSNNTSMEDIILKTKLDEEMIFGLLPENSFVFVCN